MDGRRSQKARSPPSPSSNDADGHVSKYQKPNDESCFDRESTENDKVSNDAIAEKTNDETETTRSEPLAAMDSSPRASSSRILFREEDHTIATDDDQKMEEPESKDSSVRDERPKPAGQRNVGRNDFFFREDVRSRTVMFENVKRQSPFKVKRLFRCIPKFSDFEIQRIRWEKNSGLRIVLSSPEEVAAVLEYWKAHPFGFDGRSPEQGFRVHGIPAKSQQVAKSVTLSFRHQEVTLDCDEDDVKSELSDQSYTEFHVSRFVPFNGKFNGVFLVRFSDLSQAERALSESVRIGFSRVTPRIWIERSEGSMAHRPCFNCLLYGHIADRCRSAKVCRKCGDKHGSDTCEDDSKTCINCDTIGEHMAGSYLCPYYQSWDRRTICDKLRLKKSLWPEEFLPSRAHSQPGRGTPAVSSAPCPSRDQTRPPPAVIRPQEFPPLPSTMVSRTEFQKAMDDLREEMKVSMTAFRETFSKEVDSRIRCALAQACDQISADVTATLTKGPMREFRTLVQKDMRSISKQIESLLKQSSVQREHSRSPRHREKPPD